MVPVDVDRGVADGGGGGGGSQGSGLGTPLLKTAGVDPPEIWTFQYIFFLKRIFFSFSNVFKTKWPESEEKLNFGVGGFGCL